jgi:hypothetical protein
MHNNPWAGGIKSVFSMIVTNRNFLRPIRSPNETDPPLIIDADRMLACALPRKRFELISRWHREIAQLLRSMQLQQLPKSDSSNIPVPLRFSIDPESLSLLIAKRKNHP